MHIGYPALHALCKETQKARSGSSRTAVCSVTNFYQETVRKRLEEKCLPRNCFAFFLNIWKEGRRNLCRFEGVAQRILPSNVRFEQAARFHQKIQQLEESDRSFNLHWLHCQDDSRLFRHAVWVCAAHVALCCIHTVVYIYIHDIHVYIHTCQSIQHLARLGATYNTIHEHNTPLATTI